MSNKQETISDIVAEKEAEIARLKAALAASNDELALARSNSRAMYHRLNSENIRISEMDRETIHGLRAENARLRAALKPVLEVYISQDDNSVSVYDSKLDAAFALNAVREAKRIYNEDEERIAFPRNCDRPECATTKAAQDVWRKEDGGKTAYHEWLFATSTKGGAK